MLKKDEMIARASNEARITKFAAAIAVDTVLEAITEELAAGGEAVFYGFGKFEAVDREATTGRNPRTGERIKIAAKRAVKFRPGKALTDRLNVA